MVGWHYRLDEFEQALGVDDPVHPTPGQGSLAGCSPWGLKEWDATERPNCSTGWQLETFLLCPRRWRYSPVLRPFLKAFGRIH